MNKAKDYIVKDPLVIEEAKILFRNFGGQERKYNPAGRRNFCVVIPDDDAIKLEKDGWNIKWLESLEDGEPKIAILQVNVNYRPGARPPKVTLISGTGKVYLTEKTISLLDWADIESLDLMISPYNWNINGKTGVSGYLKSMYVTVIQDKLEEKYEGVPFKSVPIDDDDREEI